MGDEIRPDFARRLKLKPPGRNDIWHLDEVVIDIAGEKRWLWGAVYQDGYVLDEIVRARQATSNHRGQTARMVRRHIFHQFGSKLEYDRRRRAL